MAKKSQQKQTKQSSPKQTQVRRTRTIQKLIQDNENIVDEKLGQTRSQSQGVNTKKITKVATKGKQNEKKKVTQAPKQNLKKQNIQNDNQSEDNEIDESNDKPKIKQVKKEIQKKKISKKQNPPKKVTPKKTPIKDEKKDKNNNTNEKKNSSNQKKEQLDEIKKETPKKSSRKPSESEKKVVEKNVKKNENKQEQKQVDQKQKLPRRTESKAAAGIVDVVFCVDTTASMGPYLQQTKNTVKTIITNIKQKATNDDISVRFGFVCYRDHPPQDYTYVTKIQDLCTEDEIITFIDKQDAQGGGDAPEAVLDGLYDAAKKIEWRDASHTPSLRYIFHVADAPPHGKEFFDGVSSFPNGVPSGINIDKVTHVINIREIHYRLINVNKSSKILDKMKVIFKEKFTNYEETDLDNAKDMDFRVSDMIIRELLPDMDYND